MHCFRQLMFGFCMLVTLTGTIAHADDCEQLLAPIFNTLRQSGGGSVAGLMTANRRYNDRVQFASLGRDAISNPWRYEPAICGPDRCAFEHLVVTHARQLASNQYVWFDGFIPHQPFNENSYEEFDAVLYPDGLVRLLYYGYGELSFQGQCAAGLLYGTTNNDGMFVFSFGPPIPDPR